VFPPDACLKFLLVRVIVPEVPVAPTGGIASPFNSSNTRCGGGDHKQGLGGEVAVSS
jgi:hypothetical protein